MRKKIVQINTTCGVGSTGKICVDISKLLTSKNIENYILYSHKTNGYELGIPCSNKIYTKFQALKSRILGNYGFNSRFETIKMIHHLKRINPDIVHIHNIHGHDCNLKMLFEFFKKKKIKVVWTFHDCWAITGYCAYFDKANCIKWKNECGNCPQFREYSFLLDKSNKLFRKKKELIDGIDLTIVTPSEWLANIVKKSFLKNVTVKVINNGIDLDIFKVTESDFKKKHNISANIKILLGVAFEWEERKGLDVFVELSKVIDKKKYQIVLVGTNEKLDAQLPAEILTIHRTKSQKELAEIYTVADVFINPTREENYPTVNMEAIACGTPVVTFDTGGSSESINNKTGIVVGEKNYIAILKAVETICNSDGYSKKDCTISAEQFNKNLKYQEYLKIYRRI